MTPLKLLIGIVALSALALIVIVSIVPVLMWAMGGEGPREPGDDDETYLRELSTSVVQWAVEDPHVMFTHKSVTYTVDASGSRLASLDTAIFPSVSPVENRVMYIAYEHSTGRFPWNTDRDWEVVTSEFDGSDRRRITNNSGFETNPVWSSDGTRIAYVAVNRQRGKTLHVMAADGSDAQMVVGSIRAARLSPVWSPDGRSIAFLTEDDGEWEEQNCNGKKYFTRPMRIVDLDGGGHNRVGSILDDTLPTWSPDGEWVIFSTFSDRPCEFAAIQAVSRDGSVARTILLYPQSYDIRGLSWSPDGTEFVIGTYIVNVAGTRARSMPTQLGLTSWSSDGSRIAVYMPSVGHDASAVLYDMATDGSDIRVLVEVDGEGNLSAANGRTPRFDSDLGDERFPCLELAEPGVLKYCDEN